MLKIGERVQVENLEGVHTIVGHGFFEQAHFATMSPAYIVRMDQGKWTEDHNAFIDTIVVHPDNVTEVNG
jgi:hypothetical protein